MEKKLEQNLHGKAQEHQECCPKEVRENRNCAACGDLDDGTTDMVPRIWTIECTARWLRCSRRQIFRFLANGRLKGVKLGTRSTRVFEESIRTLLGGD